MITFEKLKLRDTFPSNQIYRSFRSYFGIVGEILHDSINLGTATHSNNNTL